MFPAMRRHAALFVVIALLCGAGVQGQGNLRKAPALERVMNELKLVPLLLHNNSRAHADDIERLMRPIFAALPRNKDGHVGRRVARYALVRYFLVHRGWYIKGLAKAGAVWNEFPAGAVFESHLPRMLLQYIEQMLHKKSIGMEDLVSIVTAVETLVSNNVEDVLMLVYDALQLSVDRPLRDAREELLVLRAFAAFLFQPSSQEELRQPVEQYLEELRDGDYYGRGFWADVDLWAQDTAMAARQKLPNPFLSQRDFASMTVMAEAISSNMGYFQQSECQSMKHAMMDMGGGESGRISLANFYRPYKDGDRWDFSESARYLDFIGALDIINQDQKFVSIPNYLVSFSNCLETSSFHQICCINECELLMMSMEAALGKPFVAPAELARVVASLPSDSIAAPRNLSEPLRRRLDEISSRNGGTVPLHGRMFSEWMGRAFPSECPMPTEARASKGEFDEKDKLASKEEKLDVIGQDTPKMDVESATFSAQDDGGADVQMPWSEVEELLADQRDDMKATDQEKAAAGGSGWGRTFFRAVAVVAVVAATVSPLLPAGNSMLAMLRGRTVKDKMWLP